MKLGDARVGIRQVACRAESAATLGRGLVLSNGRACRSTGQLRVVGVTRRGPAYEAIGQCLKRELRSRPTQRRGSLAVFQPVPALQIPVGSCQAQAIQEPGLPQARQVPGGRGPEGGGRLIAGAVEKFDCQGDSGRGELGPQGRKVVRYSLLLSFYTPPLATSIYRASIARALSGPPA